ncbi:threonine/serine exporter family protein [Paenibacillus sp. YPG26]|uniref:threonine/serine exporter family protein n=1 Tax=Paenibacillus sp. YPG26 TaxID=2878915 RepID=UPI00203C72F1|nr:threonine/serine exporter family protein [Paenibacillus sp. YPG26]USB34977.1 threonine/serine exporter family protein [Paenibacillus sp. YPG26]
MAAQLVVSFIASAAFTILFNAPKRSLLQCGLTGMLSWFIYLMVQPRSGPVLASLCASAVVGMLSLFFARFYKMPLIIFSVAGIIPLVPGGLAYDSMRQFVENDYTAAVQLAAEAFLISGAIAMGLILSEVLNQVLRRGK